MFRHTHTTAPIQVTCIRMMIMPAAMARAARLKMMKRAKQTPNAAQYFVFVVQIWNVIYCTASIIERASWMLNTNLNSWDGSVTLSHCRCRYNRQPYTSIHNKVQIILWDLCLSIDVVFLLFILDVLSLSLFDSIASLPFKIHSLADNQHRHMHNSCVSLSILISVSSVEQHFPFLVLNFISFNFFYTFFSISIKLNSPLHWTWHYWLIWTAFSVAIDYQNQKYLWPAM